MSRVKDSTSATPPRRKRGFEAAASLLSRQVQRAAEGRGFAVSRLLTQWAEIAGADLAALARPVRITHGKGGFGATLVLLTSGPAAPLVQMRAEDLRARVNACYGYNAVQRISITQSAPQGFAEGAAPFAHAPPQPRGPDAATLARAETVAQQFADPALAAAMARLTLNHADRLSRKS
ncbi:MAG: DUF721 domain-containing protein [Paracoccus sp. (in: a-proteobacteria)]|uniref:DUF721 domain-containing protein n=1 Tax=Paracoccus sp. TaxID=267 RepID=UPI0026DFD41A|nr:DUF721 domain-containing protein [Paracoccus sp. (in: a-proteobacteria)]MDO5611826.1 DUF721 domain-containing protein [Paracoccus sp. (in: a-proteobacteria)]